MMYETGVRGVLTVKIPPPVWGGGTQKTQIKWGNSRQPWEESSKLGHLNHKKSGNACTPRVVTKGGGGEKKKKYRLLVRGRAGKGQGRRKRASYGIRSRERGNVVRS